MRIARKAIYIGIILFVLLLLGTSIQANNEALVYMFGSGKDDTVTAIKSVVDESNNLHLFVHVKNKLGNRLLHIYYNGRLYVDVVENNASEVTLYNVYSYEGSIQLLYSITTTLGEKIIKTYFWSLSTPSYTKVITSFSVNLQYYIRFLKVYMFKGLIHVFYAYYYGDIMQYMNITHIWGFTSFHSEQYSVNPKVTPENLNRRHVLDIVIDYNNNIWYIYRPLNNDTGIGVGRLHDSVLNETTEKIFTGLPEPIISVQARAEDTQTSFSAVFVQPRILCYLTFNGTLYAHFTDITYDNIVDFKYGLFNGKPSLILAENYNGYLNFYLGTKLGKGIWNFGPIILNNELLHSYTYDIELTDSLWLLSYMDYTTPSDYVKDTQYKENSAIGVFVASGNDFNYETLLENLTPYSPEAVFFRKSWIILVTSIVSSVALIAAAILLWKKNKKKLKEFLLNKEVGEHSKFMLILLNIGRYFFNIFSVIRILWFSNRRRTIMNMLSFIITGFLISSVIIIAQSEETAIIDAFYNAHAIGCNSQPSVSLESTLYWQNGSVNIPVNYNYLATEEIRTMFTNKTVASYLSTVKATYYASVSIGMGASFLTYQLAALPDDADNYLNALLTQGRLPVNSNELVIHDYVAKRFGINVNDTINLVWKEDTSNYNGYNSTMQVVGIFEGLDLAQMKRFSEYFGKSYDLYSLIDTASILTKSSLFFSTLHTAQNVNLKLRAIFQFSFDFSHFKINDRGKIVDELKPMEGKQYALSFDANSVLKVTDEISSFFEVFNIYYLNNIARLMVFSIPAILLAIFMVFESSEMFSTSYLQEIRILRNRGLRSRKIFGIYLSTRIMELMLCSFISYGVAIIAAYPLVKVNGFISFGNKTAKVRYSNPLVEIALVFAVLLLLSLPRIIALLKRKKRIEKEPNKLIKLLKAFSWREFFFLLLGFALYYYFYEQTFIAYRSAALTHFQLYLTLTIIGAIFTLLGGLPIIVKIFSQFWKAIGFISWKAKKSKTSFTLSEISKDIKYFENLTVIFLIIIAILIPLMVVPYSKESTLTDQAYFINGTDIKIRNWDKISNANISDIKKISGITAVTHIEEWTMYLGTLKGMRLVVINTTEFTSVFYKPNPKVSNVDWSLLNRLTANTAIISTTIVKDFFVHVGSQMTFINPDNNESRHTITIIDTFNLFPAFFFKEDMEKSAYLMIISIECFHILKDVITRRLKTEDSLYIRTRSPALIPNIEKSLFKYNPLFVLETEAQIKNSLKTPLYNVFIIEILLSLIVGLSALVFTSFTTALKVLEKRVIKHDILKKLGVKVPLIINLTAMQILLAAFLPALLMGLPTGFSVIKPVLDQLQYGSSPYPGSINYPIVGLLIVILGTPLLIYLGLQYVLRKEFAKYAPTRME